VVLTKTPVLPIPKFRDTKTEAETPVLPTL